MVGTLEAVDIQTSYFRTEVQLSMSTASKVIAKTDTKTNTKTNTLR